MLVLGLGGYCWHVSIVWDYLSSRSDAMGITPSSYFIMWDLLLKIVSQSDIILTPDPPGLTRHWPWVSAPAPGPCYPRCRCCTPCWPGPWCPPSRPCPRSSPGRCAAPCPRVPRGSRRSDIPGPGPRGPQCTETPCPAAGPWSWQHTM